MPWPIYKTSLSLTFRARVPSIIPFSWPSRLPGVLHYKRHNHNFAPRIQQLNSTKAEGLKLQGAAQHIEKFRRFLKYFELAGRDALLLSQHCSPWPRRQSSGHEPIVRLLAFDRWDSIVPCRFSLQSAQESIHNEQPGPLTWCECCI